MSRKLKINLLDARFPMQANLKTQELVWQAFWRKIALMSRLRNRPTHRRFILHSGPPYANGSLHMGHALNIILKDFALRFYQTQGYAIEYLPGWDTHGLPIANAVTKANIARPQQTDYRQKCATYALTQVAKQTTQFQRLGLLIDWKHRYLTNDYRYLANQMRIFGKMVAKNLVFYALRPVFWSWSSRTALAESEIEYRSFTSQAVYVAFPLHDQSRFPNTSFLVWTTTPWTLVANQFLAINQAIDYVRFYHQNRYWIVAVACWKRLQSKFAWITTDYQIIPGKQLLKLIYRHCYLPQTAFVVHGDHVTTVSGTGIVHAAPAFGPEDFELAQKYHTKVVVPIDDKGCFTSECADKALANQFYQTAQKHILTKLQQQNNLFDQAAFQHQYPHDWRTHQPVIYRATKQAFVNLKPLWPDLQTQVNRSQWQPPWGKKRLLNLLKQREQWCISRQRKWGIPLPLFFTQDERPVLAEELIKHLSTLFAEHGDQIWWDWPLQRLIPPELCRKYQIVTKSRDTMDVWFDSGCSLTTIYPTTDVDLIWEGHDQFRGWFNALMIISALLDRKQQLKTVATHGFVNDVHGLKMSKSEGNIIDPQTVCQEFGADTLRLWVASTNYYDNVNLSFHSLKQTSQYYRKIRNTFRFILNNLVDFDPQQNLQTTFTEFDAWILFQIKNVVPGLLNDLQQLNFHNVFNVLIDFCNNKLSHFYFELIKPDLYLLPPNHQQRRQHQTTLWRIYQQLLPLISILLPHTAEEIYQTLPKFQTAVSVHLTPWPSLFDWPARLQTLEQRRDFALQWHYRLAVRHRVFKALELAKQQQKIQWYRATSLKLDLNVNYQLFQNPFQLETFYTTWNLPPKWSLIELNRYFTQQKLYQYANWAPLCLTKTVVWKPISLPGDSHQLVQITVQPFSGSFCLRCRQPYATLADGFCPKCLENQAHFS